MFTEKEIKELKYALPPYASRVLHERLEISRPTIHKFFRCGDVRQESAEMIWKEGWVIVGEYREKLAGLRHHANKINSRKYH